MTHQSNRVSEDFRDGASEMFFGVFLRMRCGRVSLFETMKRIAYKLFFAGCVLLAAISMNLSAATVRKPVRTVLKKYQDPARVAVKFRDGLYVRLRNNVLISTNAEVFVE